MRSLVGKAYLLFLVTILAKTGVLTGQSSDNLLQNGEESIAPRVAQAARVDRPPIVDGIVIEDPTYHDAEPVSGGFWQTAPDEGDPSTQETEIRIVYTDRALYFGIVCYDTDPDGIIVSDSRRDASLEETDSFQFILDTHHDKLNGFVFGTNPAGIEYDAQVTNEGRGGGSGGRLQVGSGGGFNLNWDGSWKVKTTVSDIGWTAEFAIPFKTVRFGKEEVQVWGVNFQRNIRRRNENAYWAPLPRQFDLNRVSLAGTLTGLDNIRQRNLKIMPYVLGKADRDFRDQDGNPLDTSRRDADFGFDVKYGLSPSLTLDMTYNTDFAQVEVDEQQVNLNRFNLFFPEKRPFFLENAGFFSVGNSESVEMFFSRRIGLDDDNEIVPILAGARISGKAAGFNIGALGMQTESVSSRSLPGNNFAVARIQREFQNRTNLGAIFVNRQGTGSFAPDKDYNRTLALDGQLGIGEYGQISGYAARTFSPNISGREHAYSVDASYDAAAWLLNASYTEVGDNFNPEVGFLTRQGFRNIEMLVFNRHRPKDFLGLLEIRPHVSYRGFWDFTGFQETGFLHMDTHWEWRNGYEVHTGVNITREGIKDEMTEGIPDSVFIQDVFIPPGTYDHAEAQLSAMTNQGAWWSVSFQGVFGGFFGGNRESLSQTLRLRSGERFNSEFTYNYDHADLPQGSFTIHLIRARLTYSFSPKVMLQGLVQYNNSEDEWSTNIRFGWLRTANTGLFLVYNDIQDVLDGAFQTQSRSFIVKYSHLFDLLD